ncbi:MAG: thiol-disulfide oxidoreductase DCC family protein [Cytophagales bacterium]|nr:thiol-disulfide oxidoreductase DCC family protein [Cytophagales bacterium]MDW8384447.1 thiol-disulfide oxidoreductase DCC family protein [Flammeovirgaceae bacterium]
MKTFSECIILFDGICNLCNRSVNLIITYDKKEKFRFASLQSEIGKKLALQHGIDSEKLESIVLITPQKVYTKSAAALQIARRMDGLWFLLFPLYFIPKTIRDFFYDIVAKNRYRWFGKSNSCRVPTPELSKRFL